MSFTKVAALVAVVSLLAGGAAQADPVHAKSTGGACDTTSRYATSGQEGAVVMDSFGRLCNSATTSPTAIAPVASTAAEATHVIKASAGTLFGVSVTTGATAGYLMVFNATSAPVDGAVTPLKCVVAPANQSVGLSPDTNTDWTFSTGITAVFSSTGCFTKTASATAMFSWQAQ